MYLISPSEYCKYVALSYCWGNPIDASWVTTIDNLSSRQSRLRLEELPQTLRQAVAITQGLGYDYLWVDAICIVQDSLIDWEHESARMGSVYGNSFVTIAATSSASSSDGIYNIRSSDQGEQHDRIIKISTLVGGHQSVLHICCWSDAETREDEDCPHQIRNGSLSQRGWALQERLFSPRTIHYTSDQLFWECRRCYVAEDGLYLQPCFTGHSIINGGYTLARDLMAITQVPPSETEFAATWHWYERIVTPFTKRTLTRSTDKLVAVSDIARAVHDSTGATYHAGIWLASIQFGLCWRFKRPRAQSVEYRCPSYCWATYDGEIEWPIGIYDVTLPPADFIVVAHNIDTESLDAFGSVTGGYLDLFGQLKPAIVLPLMGDEEIDRGNRNVGLWDSNGHQAIPCEPFNGSFVEYDSDVTEDIDVFCFLLCSSQEELPEKIWTAWILLIQPTGDEDTFKRVGLASLWARSKGSWFDDASRRRFRIV